MDDDIVVQLRRLAEHWNEHLTDNPLFTRAAAEIEWLRTALALAVGEMSTSGEYSYLSPEALMNKFLEEARRD